MTPTALVPTTRQPPKRPIIQTMSGLLFDYLNPTFLISDIAHGLSHQCRFGGHIKWFYSVAQHSMLVSHLTEGDPLEALMHDADEAYMLDVPTPLKRILPNYTRIQDNCAEKMAEAFGYGYPYSEETHAADAKALVIEAYWLSSGITNAVLDYVPEEYLPTGAELRMYAPIRMLPEQSRAAFMARFNYLKSMRGEEFPFVPDPTAALYNFSNIPQD